LAPGRTLLFVSVPGGINDPSTDVLMLQDPDVIDEENRGVKSPGRHPSGKEFTFPLGR